MRGLSGKVSVVVGAAPGSIGGATATRLAEEGSSVVVADLDRDAAAQVVDVITGAGGVATACEVDVSSEQSVDALMSRAVSEFGGVDNVFNTAADLSPATMGVDSEADILSISTAVWDRTLDVNLTGCMRIARAVVPLMLERRAGSIVNTMSAAAWLGQATRPAYGTSKLAIEALTRHIAAAAGKGGVRCNAVAPGLVLTATASRVAPESVRREQLELIPLARLGVPEDVAGMVAFLFSDDATWITGQTLRVDGGRIMR